jgi:hypothetical protein
VVLSILDNGIVTLWCGYVLETLWECAIILLHPKGPHVNEVFEANTLVMCDAVGGPLVCATTYS